MISIKKSATTGLAALIGVGAVAMSAGSASAYVVCNGAGECWRTHKHYDYQPTYGVTVYDDNWYAAHRNDTHYKWRSGWHNDRGYYRDGVWISF
jgi:hypothetical protein